MPTSITVDKLSKRYRLGELRGAGSLRDAIAALIRRPFLGQGQEYRSIWALRDVSFEVAQGEVVGIIGRNGAGKSTLLKVLSRITYPTSGTVTTNGRVASLLEVGTGFHDELTGRENIYLNGSILGLRKREIDAKLDAIVAFADVERFLDTPIKRYSSGMRLRLGFAVAAHLEPDVLMVDEVLAVGDVGFQRKCLRAMDDLHEGGRTVLFVSHNLAAVENLCPRAIWIDGGRIREDGASRLVIANYLATFAEARGGAKDLRDVEDRHGSGEVQFTRIEFLEPDGDPARVQRSGDELNIRLYFEAREEVLAPHFGIEIYTNLGTLITSVNTWTKGFNVELLPPGKGWVDVCVECLNLIPGRYYLSLWLANVGTKFDHLDLCTTLDVEPADVYESGREIDSRFGVVFMPSRWSRGGAGTGR